MAGDGGTSGIELSPHGEVERLPQQMTLPRTEKIFAARLLAVRLKAL
jgi:hypothetical protein